MYVPLGKECITLDLSLSTDLAFPPPACGAVALPGNGAVEPTAFLAEQLSLVNVEALLLPRSSRGSHLEGCGWIFKV